MMLVSLNLVQMENLPVSPRQFFDGTAQRDAVNRTAEARILFPNLALERWRVARHRPIQRQHWWVTTTQLHQHGVHSNPVQPGREVRIRSEERRVGKECRS